MHRVRHGDFHTHRELAILGDCQPAKTVKALNSNTVNEHNQVFTFSPGSAKSDLFNLVSLLLVADLCQ